MRHSKLDVTWTGLHEVVGAVNPFVYEVRPCVPEQGKRKPAVVHVVRMRRFANAPLGTPADAREIERHDYPNNFVQQLLDHRMDNDGLKIKVRWLGFDATHDSWEPLAGLAQDVPCAGASGGVSVREEWGPPMCAGAPSILPRVNAGGACRAEGA